MKHLVKAVLISIAALFAAAPAIAADASASDFLVPRLEANGDVSIGNPAAKVTLVEYGALTCPHCAQFETQVFPAFRKVYVESGKVRFIYRPYPISAPDLLAFTILRCADPASYYDILHFLYLRQGYWVNEAYREKLMPVARGFGVSPEALAACEADKAAQDAFMQRVMDATKKYEISGTPTFVVNDVKVATGEVKPAELGKFLDEALYKKP